MRLIQFDLWAPVKSSQVKFIPKITVVMRLIQFDLWAPVMRLIQIDLWAPVIQIEGDWGDWKRVNILEQIGSLWPPY